MSTAGLGSRFAHASAVVKERMRLVDAALAAKNEDEFREGMHFLCVSLNYLRTVINEMKAADLIDGGVE